MFRKIFASSELIVTIAVILGFEFSKLNAEENQTLEEQLCQVRTKTALDCYGAKTAPAVPLFCKADCKSSWTSSFDVFYWHTYVSVTDYVSSSNLQGIPPASPRFPLKARDKSLNFDWNWGVGVDLGYFFDHDQWQIYAHYFWFSPTASDSVTRKTNSLIPLKALSTLTTNNNAQTLALCSHAKIHHEFTLHDISLELKKPFFISSMFSLTPFFGLEGIIFDKTQRIRYSGGGPIEQGGLGDGVIKIREHTSFEGLGPRVGLRTDWYMGKHFSFFANGVLSSLYGFYEIEQKQRFTSIASNRVEIKDNLHSFVMGELIQIGIGYEKYFNPNLYFKAKLSYDSQYFISLDQTLFIYAADNTKNVLLSPSIIAEGVTLELSLDF